MSALFLSERDAERAAHGFFGLDRHACGEFPAFAFDDRVEFTVCLRCCGERYGHDCAVIVNLVFFAPCGECCCVVDLVGASGANPCDRAGGSHSVAAELVAALLLGSCETLVKIVEDIAGGHSARVLQCLFEDANDDENLGCEDVPLLRGTELLHIGHDDVSFRLNRYR